MSFNEELKRRNVFKVGVAYAILAWLLVQIAVAVFPVLQLPVWTATFVTVVLIIGFPVALFLAWAYELTPEGVRQAKRVPLSASVRHVTSRRLNYVLGISLVALAGYTVAGWFWTPDATPAASERVVRRLAVLPCDNLSPDPNDSYFAPGIHEEMLNRLGRIGGLHVISRSSVMQYAESRPTVPEIARTLDVDTVMECSVRYDGNEIMLTAQLIDADTDTHLWSEAYPAERGSLRSLFDMQVDIAMNVANAIEVQFFESEIEAIAALPTMSNEAYELLLAAREQFIRNPTLTNGEQALRLLDEALVIDPAFVDAWVLKASIHNIIVVFRTGEAARAELALALEAAERILAVDPASGIGHVTKGYVLGQQGDFLNAMRQYQEGFGLGVPLASQPNFSVLQMAVGDFAGARATLEANLDLDPMNHIAAGFLLMAYEVLGDDEARAAAFERGERLYGSNWWGETVEAWLLIGDGTIEVLSEPSFADVLANQPVHALGVSTARSPEAAIAALVEMSERPESRTGGILLNLAGWAAFHGRIDLSAAWLREALRLSPSTVHIVWLPLLDELRRQPEFGEIVAEAGLVEYWQVFGWPSFCEPQGNDDFECR